MLHNLKRQRHAQTWSADFILAVFLFAIAGVAAIKLITNLSFGSSFDDVQLDAQAISSQLMSPGIPSNWNSTTLVEVGVMTSGALDTRKWHDISIMSYSQLRRLMGVQSEFAIVVSNVNQSTPSGVIVPCLIGNPVTNASLCNQTISLNGQKQVVKVDRLIASNASIARLSIYVWR